MFHKKLCVQFCLLADGSSSHGLDGMLSYSSMPRQQLLALDPNLYGGEQFRHGLTPPQLGPEQMHPYGKRRKSATAATPTPVCFTGVTETLHHFIVFLLTRYTFLTLQHFVLFSRQKFLHHYILYCIPVT